MKTEKSLHPYSPFIPKGSTKLIIGTIPPQRFCKSEPEFKDGDVNFYYGSRDNNFWRIIKIAFNTNFDLKNTEKAVTQRMNWLSERKIAITDIVECCIHKDGNASDESLIEIERKDLLKLLIANPEIKTLIYTSEFVKKQINTKFSTYHTISKENKKKQTVTIGGKEYKVRILHSPSRSGLRRLGSNGVLVREKQYVEFLTE